ncbi:hypothetical protein FXO37_20658 [Capsicum annuum]|nr:hypothetical protein FXO37_20658 [Capsicum annuum]
MDRGNKHKVVEVDRSEKRKKRVVELESKNYSEEGVEALARDEKEEIEIEARIDKEALILLHCARFISVERYDLATVLDDVGSFPAKIFVRSRFKMFNEFKQVMRVHPYLIPTVHEIKQHYMKKFKAFTDESNNAIIDGLKAHLEGVTVITSSEDGKDGDDDRNLDGNVVSRHVT